MRTGGFFGGDHAGRGAARGPAGAALPVSGGGGEDGGAAGQDPGAYPAARPARYWRRRPHLPRRGDGHPLPRRLRPSLRGEGTDPEERPRPGRGFLPRSADTRGLKAAGAAAEKGCRLTMGTGPVHEWTLLAASRAIREKEISSRELTKALLDRIDRLNPVINAYITVLRDGAMR